MSKREPIAAIRHRAYDEMPPDLEEFGRRHCIPTFVEQTWVAGFIEGWRAARGDRDDTPTRHEEGEG